MKSEICQKCADIGCLGYDHRVTECVDFQPMTNADRIRQMSDEELAKYIRKIIVCAPWCDPPEDGCEERIDCEECILKWLKSPAEEVRA